MTTLVNQYHGIHEDQMSHKKTFGRQKILRHIIQQGTLSFTDGINLQIYCGETITALIKANIFHDTIARIIQKNYQSVLIPVQKPPHL